MAITKVELKNIKTLESNSEETLCFTASLYLDGKRVGKVSNAGRGGPTCVDALDTPEARVRVKEFYEWCREQPAVEGEWGPLSMDSEFYLDLLVEKTQLQKRCAKAVLFRLVGKPKPGQYYVIKYKAGEYPAARRHVADKYGESVEEVLNDKVMTATGELI
jgi:hypothetical protein